MPAKRGFMSKAAIGKETTWGTGVAVTEELPFISEGLTKSVDKVYQEYLDRTAGAKRREVVSETVNGNITVEGVYDATTGGTTGIDMLISLAFGASAWDSLNGYAQYTLADDVNGSATVAVNKDGTVWEMQGAKINTLTISAAAGGKMQVSADLVGKALYLTGDAGIVNAASAVNGVGTTAADSPPIIIFPQLAIRIGGLSAALGAGNVVNISEFEISLNNGLSDPTFVSGSKQTIEPKRNGFREVTGTITFPRYESDTLLQYFRDATLLQMDLKFTDGTNEFNIYIPKLVFSDPPEAAVGGAALIPLSLSFKALSNADQQNANMKFSDGSTVVTTEIAVETKNGRTAAA